ncbi:response regulator receiver protein [Chloroherpeton thalassium ATCC 35110]|uniref:histidine kinase n=1 Tax=Chloroherpeton thalassium (strain ATCC 35110 / GB-78) TaxID=517418 RepID=B3QSJ6_CHLT3|nr:response regulator [Chloroherpeton thalassium]ACF14043.1 response regulator receiver protein [Chloroherpeton thalassium ATCC 35110]
MTPTHEQKQSIERRTILVVDDNQAVLKLVSHQLLLEGFHVAEAESVKEAKKIVDELSPSVIICDWMMPGEDGLSFCRYLRENPKTSGVYFIMLTAQGLHEQKIFALNSGVDDYIIKPFENQEMRARANIADRICTLQERIAVLERTQALNQMSNTVAHEINNPLTGLTGFLQLTKARLERKSTLTQEEISKTLAAINRCLEQAQRIREVVKKLSNRNDHKVKSYGNTIQMLDIDETH